VPGDRGSGVLDDVEAAFQETEPAVTRVNFWSRAGTLCAKRVSSSTRGGTSK
jgi:hypothetical protein